jgi:folate-binding protein YgfZ
MQIPIEQSTDEKQVVDSFGNDAAAIAAIETGTIVVDRSHWGMFAVSDADRLRFLHNQSTNDFESLKESAGCDTVFVTATARTIDLASAYILPDAVWLVVSPNRHRYLLDWLDRYIFFADRVQLADLSPEWGVLSLIGNGSDAIVTALGAIELIDAPYGNHCEMIVDSTNIRLAKGSGLAAKGYTLIVRRRDIAAIWQKLTNLGVLPAGEKVWESLRLMQGRPAAAAELTEDYNPLEVGLWQTISFNKGCYIGQETIARLNTYRGIKQYLWGVELTATVSVPANIMVNEEKVGTLTSIATLPDGKTIGLGYLRVKSGGIGMKVTVGAAEGTIVDVPFVSHEYP